MIEEIKKQLLSNHDALISLLTEFGFCNINIRNNEVRFARNEQGGKNIRIKLVNNDYLMVTDFVHGYRKDIISYIIEEKNTDFKTVLTTIKRLLNFTDDWRPPSKKRSLFGGCYEGIIHKTSAPIKVYDESILEKYLNIGNTKFLQDGISLNVQREFHIGYSVEDDRITIPIYSPNGELMGVKGRRNYSTDNENDPKYLYLVPCQMSRTLYGFSENYSHMYGGTIMVFESEKSVLQCASYGYNNAVALGGNNLSEHQAKMLLSLNPKRVIFMLDSDLPLEQTKRNADALKSACVMRDLQIYYFDWTECLDLSAKSSPSDEGKEVLEIILKENIKDINEI